MAEKTNLLRRYIWLLDTLQNQRLTFAQISEKWENSYELNDDNAPLPLRTFHNHRKAIYEIFGIEIANEQVGDYVYYIKESENDYKSDMQKWLVNSLILAHSPQLQQRIIMDTRTEDLFLTPLYKAMREGCKVKVTYRRKDRGYNNIHNLTIEPYYLKSFYKSWFLIGRTDDGLVRPYAFSSLENIEVTDESFAMEKDFPIKEYIATPPVTYNTRAYPDDSDMFYLERCDEQRLHRSRFRPAYRADQNNDLHNAPTCEAVKQLEYERKHRFSHNSARIRLNEYDGAGSALPAEEFVAEIVFEYPVRQPYFIVCRYETVQVTPDGWTEPIDIQEIDYEARLSTEAKIVRVPYQRANNISPEERPELMDRVSRWLDAKCSDPHFNGTNRELVEWHWKVRLQGFSNKDTAPFGNLIVEE